MYWGRWANTASISNALQEFSNLNNILYNHQYFIIVVKSFWCLFITDVNKYPKKGLDFIETTYANKKQGHKK